MQEITPPDSSQDDENDINLTPMLDVVFIMLIFFLVTASFIKETGIAVDRPDAPPTEIPGDDSILIDIDKHSDIWIGARLVDPRAVRANIERLHAEDPGARVVIRPDRESFNDTLVQVMNASREAGVYDISLASTESSGAW